MAVFHVKNHTVMIKTADLVLQQPRCHAHGQNIKVSVKLTSGKRSTDHAKCFM